jgi:hypothetical protein
MQLIDALRQAGWPDEELGNALAVISHESGGDPSIGSGFNARGTEDSWGLFQINRFAHPQYSVAQLQEPVFNSQVALSFWRSRGSYQDWVYSAQAEGLPPYGSTRHSVSEFAGLANREVGGGSGGGGGDTGGGDDVVTYIQEIPAELGIPIGVLVLGLVAFYFLSQD